MAVFSSSDVKWPVFAVVLVIFVRPITATVAMELGIQVEVNLHDEEVTNSSAIGFNLGVFQIQVTIIGFATADGKPWICNSSRIRSMHSPVVSPSNPATIAMELGFQIQAFLQDEVSAAPSIRFELFFSLVV